MDLIFLGTAAGMPSKTRNVSAVALTLFQERGSFWLFDCGEGTQHQFLRSPLTLNKLERLFITHMHGDHVFGIPGLLGSRSAQGVTNPLTIYGPPGLKAFIEACVTSSHSHLHFPLSVIELCPPASPSLDEVVRDDQFVVETAWLDHGVPCLGYRITEQDRPGKLDTARLQALGVPPGPVYGKLKRGETVLLPNGRTLTGNQFLSQPQPGRIITILGDTRPCTAAVLLGKDADVLVHEATFAASEAHRARAYGHSTTLDAARTAQTANVSRLIMTHISARYQGADIAQLANEAKSVFPASDVADDFAMFAVPLRSRTR